MDATLQSTGPETPDSSAMCQDLKPIHSMSLSMAGNGILQKASLRKATKSKLNTWELKHWKNPTRDGIIPGTSFCHSFLGFTCPNFCVRFYKTILPPDFNFELQNSILTSVFHPTLLWNKLHKNTEQSCSAGHYRITTAHILNDIKKKYKESRWRCKPGIK